MCSERREVYYEWQCVETQKRLSLIDFIALKSRQLGLGLPWGKFDRIEMQAVNGRIIAQHQHNRFVFVRSNTRVRPPGGEGHGTLTVQAWLAQQAPVRGVLAIGVTLADRKVLTQAFAADIGLTALNTAWPSLADTFEAAARLQFSVWQLRWIYERAQLYCVRRADGASLGLILEKTPATVDEAAVERCFAEFQTLRAD